MIRTRSWVFGGGTTSWTFSVLVNWLIDWLMIRTRSWVVRGGRTISWTFSVIVNWLNDWTTRTRVWVVRGAGARTTSWTASTSWWTRRTPARMDRSKKEIIQFKCTEPLPPCSLTAIRHIITIFITHFVNVRHLNE